MIRSACFLFFAQEFIFFKAAGLYGAIRQGVHTRTMALAIIHLARIVASIGVGKGAIAPEEAVFELTIIKIAVGAEVLASAIGFSVPELALQPAAIRPFIASKPVAIASLIGTNMHSAIHGERLSLSFRLIVDKFTLVAAAIGKFIDTLSMEAVIFKLPSIFSLARIRLHAVTIGHIIRKAAFVTFAIAPGQYTFPPAHAICKITFVVDQQARTIAVIPNALPTNEPVGIHIVGCAKRSTLTPGTPAKMLPACWFLKYPKSPGVATQEESPVLGTIRPSKHTESLTQIISPRTRIFYQIIIAHCALTMLELIPELTGITITAETSIGSLPVHKIIGKLTLINISIGVTQGTPAVLLAVFHFALINAAIGQFVNFRRNFLLLLHFPHLPIKQFFK